jgi:hypothetical protein
MFFLLTVIFFLKNQNSASLVFSLPLLVIIQLKYFISIFKNNHMIIATIQSESRKAQLYDREAHSN